VKYDRPSSSTKHWTGVRRKVAASLQLRTRGDLRHQPDPQHGTETGIVDCKQSKIIIINMSIKDQETTIFSMNYLSQHNKVIDFTDILTSGKPPQHE
jgi:hypothetical protein